MKVVEIHEHSSTSLITPELFYTTVLLTKTADLFKHWELYIIVFFNLIQSLLSMIPESW